MEEYLTPSGKMMSEYDLEDLSIEQVFNMLIKLKVADKALYRDYLRINDIEPTRTRSRSRTVYVYQQPKVIYRTRALSPIKRYYTAAPLPGTINPSILTKGKLKLRKASTSIPTPKKYFTAPPLPGRVNCNVWGSQNMCINSGCKWVDGVCYDA